MSVNEKFITQEELRAIILNSRDEVYGSTTDYGLITNLVNMVVDNRIKEKK